MTSPLSSPAFGVAEQVGRALREPALALRAEPQSTLRLIATRFDPARVVPWSKWGLLWRSRNRLDGETRHIMGREGLPFIFRTRKEARAFAKTNYGYIKESSDLKREPYGWRMPVAIRIVIAPRETALPLPAPHPLNKTSSHHGGESRTEGVPG